ncbi:O-antigen ligase family protein [Arthrobacter sp. H5]|uniref:O-antigen ligase family protein n=1 Tax=Arthrobacter sp. H5 TaxID=1267973 RepID=UPI0004B0DDF3|nr:O-antigen ligase family protein [Arthrobacter sp. H5]
MSAISLVLFLSLAATLWLITVLVIAKWPAIGIAFTVLVIFTLWEFPNIPPIAQLFGFALYFNDVLATALFANAIHNISTLRSNLRGSIFPWLTFIILTTFSLVTGAHIYGLGSAITEGRAFFLLALCMTWSLSLPWSNWARTGHLYRIALTLGFGLIALAAYHATRYGVGTAETAILLDAGQVVTGRVLVAGQALSVVFCMAITASHWYRTRSKLAGCMSTALLLVAIVSQHRSVWLAAAVALTVVIIFSPLRVKKSVFGGLIVFGSLSVAILLTGVADNLITLLLDSASQIKSVDARAASWPQLIEQSFARGWEYVVFGQPFGSGYVRIEPNGMVATFMPHNWYVSLFLRTGALGLLAHLILFGSFLVLAIRRRATIGLFILTAISVYALAYNIDWYHHFFAAYAIASIAFSRSCDKSRISPHVQPSINLKQPKVWQGVPNIDPISRPTRISPQQ